MKIKKYKAWDLINKKWIEKFYVPSDEDWIAEYKRGLYLGDHPYVIVPKDEFVLVEYTTVNDVNDEEIYEGDIVKRLYKRTYEPQIFEVKWMQTKYRLGWNLAMGNQVKRIGNVFENPDLLKGDKS